MYFGNVQCLLCALNVFIPDGCVTLFGGTVGIKVIDKFCAGTWRVLSYGCPLADSIIPHIYQNKTMISQSSFLRFRTPDHPLPRQTLPGSPPAAATRVSDQSTACIILQRDHNISRNSSYRRKV